MEAELTKNNSKFNNFFSFLDSKKEKTINKLNQIKKQLKSENVDISELEKISKKHVEISAVYIKNNRFNFGKVINSIVFEFQQSNLIQQISFSLIILCVVILINTFCSSLFQLYFSKTIAFALSAIIIAPLVEETGKFISIETKSTMSYFITFNIAEFSLYLFTMLSAGMSLPVIIIGRSLAVLLHGLTTYIQKKGYNKNDKTKHFLSAILIHGIWNFNAIKNML